MCRRAASSPPDQKDTPPRQLHPAPRSTPLGEAVPSNELKHGAAFTQPAIVANQYVPEVVTDFMTKVAEQGPVRLAHLCATPFALDIVGFFQGYRNEAVVVPG